jgi:PAS domain S-box-containing protein
MYTAPLPTALVINDDPSQLHLMVGLLQKDGLRVVHCQNAEEALEILDEGGTVDVIITDLHMPGIDGWRLCQLLRSSQYAALNTVPVLVVSATFSGTDTEQMTTELGANAFLAVPYDAMAFRETIRHLLAGRTPQIARHVVLVEDNIAQNAILRRAFEAQGYKVSTAATGAEGQRLLRGQTPELAVIDYYLPDMTGDQLLREFVRPESSMVAVVMTHDSTPEVALQCMRLGADGFVHKPFEPEYLLALCTKARRGRALLRVEELLEERTKKLQESEAKFRLLFESIPDTVLVHDDEGYILYVNEVGAQWLDWPASELIGKHLRDIVAPQCFPQMSEQRPTPYRQNASRSKIVYVARTGQCLEAEVNTCPIEFWGQMAVLAVVRDITERTRLEAQLRQAQKMQAIGTLAGGIAHDFNNILAAILGYTELALYDIPLGSRMQRHLEEVLTAGKRARDLVQQILAFSRQRLPERQPVQLHLLISDMLRMLRASLPSTIAIHPHLMSTVGRVMADPTQLQQVLMNLCTNAEHAMREAGGVLTVQLEAIEITADFAATHAPLTPGPHACILIRDTGHGMAAEVMERIFEPFFTTKAVGEGTGMGLAVVDGIIASHGGVITVASTPGQGTTFAIYLPRIDTDVLPLEVPEETPIPQGNGSILFVDDEPTLAHMTAEMLSCLGYEATVHTSSVEALKVFQAAPWQYDVVITDQTMPVMTGEHLARELRRIRPDIPIILCSGFSHTMTASKAQTLSIDAFLLKPLGFRELGLALQQVLERRRAL